MPESVSAIASRISPTRIDGNQIEALMRAVLAEMEPLDRASRKRRGEAYRSQFYNRQHTVWNTVLNTCRFYYSDQGTPVRGPRTEQLFEEAERLKRDVSRHARRAVRSVEQVDREPAGDAIEALSARAS